MEVDGNRPRVGRSARALGVRVDVDIEPDSAGRVYPNAGGMSVAPDDALFLVPHRRPKELGGTGTDPVWRFEDAMLPSRVAFRPDSEKHGVIEPSGRMSLSAYESALTSTRDSWELA
jgi:hypothetical protein